MRCGESRNLSRAADKRFRLSVYAGGYPAFSEDIRTRELLGGARLRRELGV